MATGVGGIALAALMAQEGLLAAGPDGLESRPLAPRPPHFPARAKQVLHIFCTGAVSHLDTFDYKPELIKRHGQPMPGAKSLITFQGENGALNKSPWTFKPRGQSGKFVSDLLPHLAERVDDLCFIHSLTSKTNTHGPGEMYMSTGFTLEGFPSIGAWVSYALGTENQDLPAYVAIPDPRGDPQQGPANWMSGFLPAVYQGTSFNADKPIRHLARPDAISRLDDQAGRDFLRLLNDEHLKRHPGDTDLSARIASYELAARMQLSAPEVGDLSPKARPLARSTVWITRTPSSPASAATACWPPAAGTRSAVRHALQRGLRHGRRGAQLGRSQADQVRLRPARPDPRSTVRACLIDLKARGMLDDTLVVWTTEFGRMPTFQKGAQGRDHNPKGFTAWLAGAGVKHGFSFGATDPFGYQAVENVVDVHDFHATILHLLGLNHEKLTYYHNGTQRGLRMFMAA